MESAALPVHGAWAPRVSVSVTSSVAMSPDPGVYRALAEPALSKLPSPLVLHIHDELFDEFPTSITVLPVQTNWSAPALDVGCAPMVMFMESATLAVHGAIAAHVSVSVTSSV